MGPAATDINSPIHRGARLQTAGVLAETLPAHLRGIYPVYWHVCLCTSVDAYCYRLVAVLIFILLHYSSIM